MLYIDVLSGPIGAPTSTKVVYGTFFNLTSQIHVIGTGLTVNANGIVDGGTITLIRVFDAAVSPENQLVEVRFTGGGVPGSSISDFVDTVLPVAQVMLTWPDFFSAGLGQAISVSSTVADFAIGNGTIARFNGSGFVEGTYAVGTVNSIQHIAADGVTVLNEITGLSLTSLEASSATGANPFALYESLTGGPGRITVNTPDYDFFATFPDAGAGNDTIEGSSDPLSFNGRGVAYYNAVAAVTVDLDTGAGTGRATGGAGTDTLINIDHVFGSAFDDRTFGNGAGNNIDGYFGNDLLRGEEGDDFLFGGQGNDELFGGDGADYLDGGRGDDVLNGGLGSDYVAYLNSAGPITLDLRLNNRSQDTGDGIDTLVGIENAYGSYFGDTINGSNFANVILGLDGDDTIRGLGGDDQIWGGVGLDTLIGGLGADGFNLQIYSDEFGYFFAEGQDRLLDFQPGVDQINLVATFDVLTELAAANFFVVGSGAQDSDDFVTYNPTNGRLYYDSNGNGAGLGNLVAILQVGTTVVASDIHTDFIV